VQSFDHYRNESCPVEKLRTEATLYRLRKAEKDEANKRHKADTPLCARITEANALARTCTDRWAFTLQYKSDSNWRVRAAVLEDLFANPFYKEALTEADTPEIERVLESLFHTARAKYNDLSGKGGGKGSVYLLEKALKIKYSSRKSRVRARERGAPTRGARARLPHS
jgi:hypothetical protein